MNKYISSTTIEYLPNELFLEIFQYINTRDLYRGWFKLNKRFKAILRSVSMHAHLKAKNDYKDYKTCFRNYASQFLYIRIERDCDIPETFDVSSFTNIRSLYLDTVTCKQYDQITPETMPYLTHLTIDQLQAHRNPVFLLCGEKQFVRLTTCHLPYFFSTNAKLQSCLTLRSLRLNFCSSEMFFGQVKVLLPNLVYFESSFRMKSTDIDFTHDKQSLTIPHNNLCHLKIELDENSTSDFLPLLFTVMPELHCLELCCRCYCNYRQIADLLQARLPQLKQFSLIVNESANEHLLYIDVLKGMSPWFAQMKIEQYNDNRRIICNVKKGE